ncbi:MAG: glycosyltransferase [Flavobacteriales bacterium]|nr:glycosyltransferase [Flavobacteriales bacterium]
MKVAVLVSNDLVHDQRVSKVCEALRADGHQITLIGRKTSQSLPLDRPYRTRRMALGFSRGAGFYAMLQIRLFFYLLFRRFDVVHCNDLDTLLPAFLLRPFKRWTLVYDSHEYFTEAAGLTGRTFQKNVWLAVERWIFPRLKYVVTVNQSIADIYKERYKADVKVVRNIPRFAPPPKVSRADLNLPENKHIILLQGAYIDHDRGCLEAVEAMQWVDHALFLIIGSGQEIPAAKELCQKLGLQDRIRFMDKMPFDTLRQYTAAADVGLSVDKPLHLNYKLSLPNKLFDYIHCHTPVVATPLPEIRRIVETYHVGMLTKGYTAQDLADAINKLLESRNDSTWETHLAHAAQALTWEKEQQVFLEIYNQIGR